MAWAGHPVPDFNHPGLLAFLHGVPLLGVRGGVRVLARALSWKRHDNGSGPLSHDVNTTVLCWESSDFLARQTELSWAKFFG